MNGAGSNNQLPSAEAPGGELLISALPIGSRHGPVGESPTITPVLPPLLAKYRKNCSLPSMTLLATPGAHELPAHLATPFGPATLMAPSSRQFIRSSELMT